MRKRRRWGGDDDAAEDAIKVVGQLVATRINVYGEIKGLDEDSLFNPPYEPVVFR